MPRENGLENQRVVIVGGSSGIGLAVADLAASQGAKVSIVSSNAERVHKAVKSVGGEAQGEAVDVSDERAVAHFFTKLGAFDHLVFTAGDSLHLHNLAATDLKQARRAFELRYWSALAVVKYGSPQFCCSHNWSRRPTPTHGMGNCSKCVRRYRSPYTRFSDRVGADSCKRGVSWSRSNKPLAEHELSRTRASVRERRQESARRPGRRSS